MAPKRPSFLPFDVVDAEMPAVDAQRFGPGHVAQQFGVHGHDFHEIVVFDCRGGMHEVADTQRPAVPGAIDIISEGVVHSTSALGAATGWMVLIRDDEIARTALAPAWETGEAARYLAPAAAVRIAAAAEAIAREARDGRRYAPVAIRAHLATIFVELLRLGAPQPYQAGNEFLRRFVAEVDARLGTAITLRSIASALGFSPAYLTTHVRCITGRTAMEWVVARRLRAAQHLLVSTDDSITSIALATGFSDGGHFARRFREHFGAAPADWRARSVSREKPSART